MVWLTWAVTPPLWPVGLSCRKMSSSDEKSAWFLQVSFFNAVYDNILFPQEGLQHWFLLLDVLHIPLNNPNSCCWGCCATRGTTLFSPGFQVNRAASRWGGASGGWGPGTVPAWHCSRGTNCIDILLWGITHLGGCVFVLVLGPTLCRLHSQLHSDFVVMTSCQNPHNMMWLAPSCKHGDRWVYRDTLPPLAVDVI